LNGENYIPIPIFNLNLLLIDQCSLLGHAQSIIHSINGGHKMDKDLDQTGPKQIERGTVLFDRTISILPILFDTNIQPIDQCSQLSPLPNPFIQWGKAQNGQRFGSNLAKTNGVKEWNCFDWTISILPILFDINIQPIYQCSPLSPLPNPTDSLNRRRA
jgi:hypothetical protein